MRIALPLVVLACGLAACSETTAPAPQVPPRFGVAAGQRVPFRIESWLHRAIGGNPLVTGSITSCAKVWIGDQLLLSGQPSWTTEAEYLAHGDAAFSAAKCAGDSWGPVGGYRMEGQGHLQEGNLGRLDHILFARHKIALEDGSFDIQFEAKYSPIFVVTACNWVIRDGTGAYSGLQGNGGCEAQGFPVAAADWNDMSTWDIYFVHTETGTVHWTGR